MIAGARDSPTSPSYKASFFEAQAEQCLRSAATVVPMVLEVYRPKSVVDIGCSVGTWLAAFVDNGIDDVVGVDGDYVPRELLRISEDAFVAHDLEQPLELGRAFDLAVCLEVAEHLSATAAPTLVKSLTSLAPVVLFSAAVPLQGGVNHINEQWPDYWIDLFEPHGFTVVDCLRSQLWERAEVEWYYAQNCMLMVSREALNSTPELAAAQSRYVVMPTRVVHPRLYNARTRHLGDPTVYTLRELLRALPDVARSAARRRLQDRH